MKYPDSRRGFLARSLAAAQVAGERPTRPAGVHVLNPLDRLPVSFIIDDSTCLVNLAHFGIPHFAEVYPHRYREQWRSLPREIPDAFVRRFGEWCHQHGVKGKYSIVPYPACVGWVDRDMPGWTRRELDESLKLVRTLMTPDWDIHPEGVSHTFAIDTRTGRPYPERSERFLENNGFSVGKSADELADYLTYQLRILRNAGLECEGITTPGSFGRTVLGELARAVLESCREVYRTEIPHYFHHAFTDARSVAPQVQLAAGLTGADPRCVVSIIACTGDWTGGWTGLEQGSADRFITADLTQGRLPEIARRGEPVVFMCHWAGLYSNGQETGFRIFQEVVLRLKRAYPDLLWMKLSDIARYWAARELTTIGRTAGQVTFRAPFACPRFTLRLSAAPPAAPRLARGREVTPLVQVKQAADLRAGTWLARGPDAVVCLDLPKGESRLEI